MLLGVSHQQHARSAFMGDAGSVSSCCVESQSGFVDEQHAAARLRLQRARSPKIVARCPPAQNRRASALRAPGRRCQRQKGLAARGAVRRLDRREHGGLAGSGIAHEHAHEIGIREQRLRAIACLASNSRANVRIAERHPRVAAFAYAAHGRLSSR